MGRRKLEAAVAFAEEECEAAYRAHRAAFRDYFDAYMRAVDARAELAAIATPSDIERKARP